MTLFSYHSSTLGNQLMARHIEKTNPALISLITDLKKSAYENKAPIWKDIAERLEKPLRNWPEVNLHRIDLYVHEKETALIPGKVLSPGKLTKKVSIAAWSFSEKAHEKIKKAGGKTLTIEELLKNNPKGKDIRIVG
jgi:large subunit ribosomal protein L18e